MQKFMQKMFPSKAGKERLKKLEKLDKLKTRKSKRVAMNKLKKLRKKEEESEESSDEQEHEEEEKTTKTKKKKRKSKMRRSASPFRDEDDEDDEDDEYDGDYEEEEGEVEDEDDEDDEDDDEEYDDYEELGKNMKFNIVFTVNEDGSLERYSGDNEDGELVDYDEEESEIDDDDEEEEKKEKKHDFKEGDVIMAKEKHWDKSYKGTITKVLPNNKYNIKLCDKDLERRNWKGINKKSLTLVNTKEEEEDYVNALEEIKELVSLKKKGKKSLLKRIDELSAAADKKQKEAETKKSEKEQKKNGISFRNLLQNKTTSNDIKFFNSLKPEKQRKLLAELKEVNKHNNVDRPYRITLLESDIPVQYKAMALKKINILNHMDPGSGEYYKIKQWVDGFMQIPFGKYTELPIKLDDGKEKCSDFMDTAMSELNSAVYGLNDAKMQILQYLGQLIANPKSVGSAIGICGPPGTGKTTMLRALSAILKRPFTLIAAGGASDGSVFEGHAYTYEGSKPGKFVESLMQLKTMNPIFGVDELDKLSNTPRGEEVSGIFTHAIDTTFNDKFEDKYYSSIKLDLSKAIWVFTYNDERRINPILADRMYKINTEGYNTKDKLTIAKDYLIPKIEKNINFKKNDIVFNDEVLTNIIENYTDEERGVRNLKRCLEIIFTKLNLFKMMSPNSKLFDGEEVLDVTEGFEITNDIIKKLIKKQDINKVPYGLYL
jgi:ATP-dependent Lon protease